MRHRAALPMLWWLGASLMAPPPTHGQQMETPPRLDPVVVTVGRIEQRAGEAPASVTVITPEEIRASPSVALDDLLRQVPSFSLFRRSSSLVTHPTAQGVSLRGIGPSGASRALVLVDGVPINDPFGGWVPWSRVPLLSVEQIEIVRGGGSAIWGNGALGGVIQVLTRRPTARSAAVQASLGSHGTEHVGVLATDSLGPWRLSLEGDYFDTDGYPIVAQSRRGAIDVDADSRRWVFNGRLELVVSPELTLFAAGALFDEARGNGTPLQKNETRSGSWATGATLQDSGGGRWEAAVFSHGQAFRSTFSTQALDRGSETLALDQRVPSTSAGGSLVWSRRFGKHLVLAGGDARWVEGDTIEDVFAPAGFVRRRIAGGEQVLAGVFLQDVFTPTDRIEIVLGIRGDYWRTYDGSRRDTPPPAGVPARQTFPELDELIPSPRLAVLVRATSTTDVHASAYQGFRVPTLNELYRLFRVRNDVTVANERLRPERLTGGEVGVRQRWAPIDVRVTGFWNEVTDQIANVTLGTPLADCPAGTTCRQRQNLDLTRIRGVETELEVRPARSWRLLVSHVLTDARVVEAHAQPSLEGRRLAQVPRHVFTLGARWERPEWVSVAADVRWVGDQFEDDLNMLPLGQYTVVDLQLSRRLTAWAETFVAVENLLDERFAVARTSEGVVSIGAPRMVRGGLRLAF